METIIFIGVNKSGSSREAIKAAERLGYYTVLFTTKKKQIIQREEYPDVHKMIYIDFRDVQGMNRQIKNLQLLGHEICLITSFTDQSVSIASLLADTYCQNLASTTSIEMMENKQKTRAFFENESFTPNFVVVPPNTDIDYMNLDQKLSFPVIVKSPQSTGSKDVLLAENTEQLRQRVKVLRQLSPDETLIIEDFVSGKQYLVEVVVYQDQINPIAIIQQEITKGERFIVTGYGVMTDIPKMLEHELLEVVNQVVQKLDIEYGTLHLEMRRTENGMKLIEVNPRISGGAMNDMIEAAFGYSLVEETLKMFLGQRPSFERKKNLNVYTKHVIVPTTGILEKVTGKGRAKRSNGVVKVYVKPKKGTLLTPPFSMGDRYAHVIAAAPSLLVAEKLAVKAANEIEFHICEDED